MNARGIEEQTAMKTKVPCYRHMVRHENLRLEKSERGLVWLAPVMADCLAANPSYSSLDSKEL
jgi:hypothetical protein